MADRYIQSTKEAEDALITWVKDGFAGEVILAEQDGPRPKKNFATIRVSEIDDGGIPYTTAPNAEGMADIHKDHAYLSSIQFYGDGAMEAATTLRNTLYRFASRLVIERSGMVAVRAEPVRNLTAIVSTEHEPRAGVDIEWRAARLIRDDLGCIETVEVTGTADDYTKTETIEVSNVPSGSG